MAQTIDVLHVIDSLAPGGSERVLIELVNGLHRQHTHVGVCVTRSNLELAEQLIPQVPLIVLRRRGTWDVVALLLYAML